MAAAHVWLARIDGLDEARFAEYRQWLSPGERERTFVREGRRRQFIAARALLRIAIGALLHVPARSVELGGAPGRAPWLAAPAVPMPGLSVSHSGPWVACALSADTALGLDIEMKDAARDIAALAEHAFDAATCARLAALPDGARIEAFYVEWSAQEARVKLGVAAEGCYALAHEELSVVVCSAVPLARPALLEVVDL
ncbi:4'-phosphopantetheinyl transferase family protein [Pseudoduganella lutea]|uniref:4'-phosphopantetheinyl transferase superfamily protein n=1 Tax=Pseudoduganella lutea TaxID=321985 RepID=A0A4P6L0N4_9BURK|nr:4'-phosphopantetheinyl transferase superfamily protein [Pseudoduganella lutea]QBE65049.1 4'-phosphopantetheinyl transferase superfamily protein [Pseudoduganella lutea]